MADLSIVHVVPRWNHGGGAQSILAEAAHARATGNGLRHEAVSLEQGGSLPLVRAAMRMRVRVHLAPAPDEERALLRPANAVVLHYWNTPSIRAFMDRWRGRRLPWVLYARVNGRHQPQLLPKVLLNSACYTLLTSPHAVDGIEHDRFEVLPAVVPATHDSGDARPEPTRSVFHAGTLNVFKLTPSFVPLHAGLVSRGDPIGVAGAGGDEDRFREDAERIGVADQFQWLGFVTDLPSACRQYRVFSAATAPFTYASSDKTIQECQLAGVPVLLRRDAPVAHLVREGVTGFLAGNDNDYRSLLERIVARELSLPTRDDVRAAARCQHDTPRKCRRLAEIYRDIHTQPAREIDDGFPELSDWVRYQAGDLKKAQEHHRRPSLEALRDDSAVYHAHQRWACEGGLAQYANAHEELRMQLDW